MSRIVFWYILKDLLRVFVMASLVLGMIMSFGGLIRPLMEHGLSGSQVGRMLLFFLPATQTYSLPIAALFATTVVYGRLSADNELTACRAGGMSYAALTSPALVLGLLLSIVALVCLCFVVPHFTLKVEKVVFASLADVVQKRIARTHQIRLGEQVVYAERAEVLPPPPDRPDDEVVVLYGAMFCTFDRDRGQRRAVPVPDEFFMARSATVTIRRTQDDVEFTAQLEGGFSFPRATAGGGSAAIASVSFGPVHLESPIRENPKFMDIRQLKRLYRNPAGAREIRYLVARVTQQEQEREYLARVVRALDSRRQMRFDSTAESFVLVVDPSLRIPPADGSRLSLAAPPDAEPRPIRLSRMSDGQVISTDEARELTLRLRADPPENRIFLEFRLSDAVVGLPEGQPLRRLSFLRTLSIPMPADLAAYRLRSPHYYLANGSVRTDELRRLREQLPELRNGIEAEIHSRISFALSCLILVMVGCPLGMMFRAGNYLSAFALSVVPALICIALNVTGQHVAENQPENLRLGLGILWSGNLMVLVLAAAILAHLRRQ